MSVRSSMVKARTKLVSLLARSSGPARRRGGGLVAEQRAAALRLLDLGRFDEAVVAARDLVAWLDRRGARDPRARRDARALLLRCLLAGVSPHVEEAHAVAGELLEAGDAALGADDAALADALAWLAENSERHADLEGARRLLEAALGIRERTPEASERQVTYTLENLSRVLTKLGRLEPALEHRARAVANRERIHGPDHSEVALGMAAMANLLWDMGHSSAARTCYRRAMDMVHEAPVEQIPAELRRELSEFPGLMREIWAADGEDSRPTGGTLVN